VARRSDLSDWQFMAAKHLLTICQTLQKPNRRAGGRPVMSQTCLWHDARRPAALIPRGWNAARAPFPPFAARCTNVRIVSSPARGCWSCLILPPGVPCGWRIIQLSTNTCPRKRQKAPQGGLFRLLTNPEAAAAGGKSFFCAQRYVFERRAAPEPGRAH
jgi:hypothetical protein